MARLTSLPFCLHWEVKPKLASVSPLSPIPYQTFPEEETVSPGSPIHQSESWTAIEVTGLLPALPPPLSPAPPTHSGWGVAEVRPPASCPPTSSSSGLGKGGSWGASGPWGPS